MRLASPMSFITVIALSLASSVAAAQCTPGFNGNTAVCASSNGCQGEVDYWGASDPGPFGVPFACGTIYCCTTGLPDCYQLPGSCNYVKLTDPGVRHRLLKLAKSEDLMVATCVGKYAPLSAALGEDARPVLNPRRSFARLTGAGE